MEGALEMANLTVLYRLQQSDLQLEDNAEALSRLEGSSEGSEALRQAEAAWEKAKAEKREGDRKLKNAELQLASLENEKKQTQEKLYSGKVTNSKELSQLEKDLESLGKRRSQLDGEVLDFMDKLEKADALLVSSERKLAETKSQDAESHAAGESRKAELQKLRGELEARRQSLVQSLDEAILEKYQDLRKRHAGLAIVKLQKNSCGGCFMLVPESSIQKVKVLELEYCSSCGRILYLDKES